MDMTVGCQLSYTLDQLTGFIFQIEVAKAEGQYVTSESLVIPGGSANSSYVAYTDFNTATRKIRTLIGPGSVDIYYEATVNLNKTGVDPRTVWEFDFVELPMELLEYLAPSRYCASDTFTSFASRTFGEVPRGHGRVTAICNWIHANIRYQAGSTTVYSNSADVFQKGSGVCRDFAHLGISLCRALGIPARYASAYADALAPQDFHAVFQAYLKGPQGGAWYTFDASHMSSADAIVRIAAGRDAADVAFAWPQAQPTSYAAPVVWAKATNRSAASRTTLAIGGP